MASIEYLISKMPYRSKDHFVDANKMVGGE